MVRVEPLQNLLPALPTLLVPQSAGAAGTAPAALMADTKCQFWGQQCKGAPAVAAASLHP